jgi:hypothetical protein
MSPYRLGTLRVQDEEFGELALQGDGYAAAGELASLLASREVTRVLALAATEQAAIDEALGAYRQSVSRLYEGGPSEPPSTDVRMPPLQADLESDVERVLGPERTARLLRLSWRVRGGEALAEPAVAAALALTPEQRVRLARELQESEADNARILRSVSGARDARLASPQPLESAGQDAVRASSERMLSVLTPEQRDRFDGLRRGK